jgi:hypothetical protein
MPQLAPNKNLPLAGELRLEALQLGLEDEGSDVSAPVFESMLYPKIGVDWLVVVS